jgi:hypothetical protein
MQTLPLGKRFMVRGVEQLGAQKRIYYPTLCLHNKPRLLVIAPATFSSAAYDAYAWTESQKGLTSTACQAKRSKGAHGNGPFTAGTFSFFTHQGGPLEKSLSAATF